MGQKSLVDESYGAHRLVAYFHIVQNMAGEIFVHACHILKRAETCLVASQNIILGPPRRKKLVSVKLARRASILKI